MTKNTIEQIARKAGVHKSTVSRVINNSPNVTISAKTKKKIFDLIRKIGYRKNILASRFARGTRELAVITCEDHPRALFNPYHHEIMVHLQILLGKTGNYLIYHQYGPETDRFLDKNIDESMCRGIILLGSRKYKYLEEIGGRVPVLRLLYPKRNKYESVILQDRKEEARLLIDYLVKHGRSRILVVMYSRNKLYAELDAVLCKTAKQYQNLNLSIRYLSDQKDLYLDNLDDVYARYAGGRLLADVKQYDAVVSMTLDGFRLYLHLLKMGVKMPEDIAYINFDSVHLTRTLFRDVTTVGIDYQGLAGKVMAFFDEKEKKRVDYILPIIFEGKTA